MGGDVWVVLRESLAKGNGREVLLRERLWRLLGGRVGRFRQSFGSRDGSQWWNFFGRGHRRSESVRRRDI